MSTFDDMFARLTNPASKLEGSWSVENLRAVANEIDRLQSEGIDYMPYLFFPHLTSGDDLTMAASNFGVDRKPAEKASVTLVITGDADAAITSEMRVSTSDEIYFVIDNNTTIPAGGSSTVTAKALVAGSAGNVAAGTIVQFGSSYPGLTTVTNPAAAHDGADEESDKDLMQRVDARWKYPSTGGNLYDYRRWALDVNGVSRVKVANPSSGNITITVVATGNEEASADLIASVEAAIEQNRLVGASVTVNSGTAVTLPITVTMVLHDGYTVNQVKDEIRTNLAEYLGGLTFKSDSVIVSYAKIADLLFVDGVADVTSYTVNGGTSSITISGTQFPKLGEVTISVAT